MSMRIPCNYKLATRHGDEVNDDEWCIPRSICEHAFDCLQFPDHHQAKRNNAPLLSTQENRRPECRNMTYRRLYQGDDDELELTLRILRSATNMVNSRLQQEDCWFFPEHTPNDQSCWDFVPEPMPLGSNGIQDLVSKLSVSNPPTLEASLTKKILLPSSDLNHKCITPLSPKMPSLYSSSIPDMAFLETKRCPPFGDESSLRQPNKMKRQRIDSFDPNVTPSIMEEDQDVHKLTKGLLTIPEDGWDEDTSCLVSNYTFMGDYSDSTMKRRVVLRNHHFDLWNENFQDLLEFKKQHGHCLVPNHYPSNPKLALWVKRNRYQYKLQEANRQSCLTEERLAALEEIGFVWNPLKL